MLPKKMLAISILTALFIFTIHSSYSQCLDHQKTLLLQLKNGLIFDSSISTKLVKWNESEACCKWKGVECDAAGYVVGLQLDHEAISGGIDDSSSLFRLMHLQKLNLAYNDINSAPIPKGIHNLTYLTHLNLSNAAFGGQLPSEITSLKRLVSLDISNDVKIVYATIYSTSTDMVFMRDLILEYPNLEMLVQNLTGLRELYLDGVDITSSDERRKWSHIISSNLPNLTALSLRRSGLSGPLANSFWQLHSLSILQLDLNNLSAAAPDLFANFSNLSTLSLAGCLLNGSFPDTIFRIPSLQYLDITNNGQLSGSIPQFTQTGSLKSLLLGGTNFSGSIPSSISYLNSLSVIRLTNCKFSGSIPSTFANLTQLSHVYLSDNFFTGSLSSALFEGLSNLVYLDLNANSFSGDFPQSLLGLPSLWGVVLSNNQFSGVVEELPTVNVSNIVSLDLSNNQLAGPIPNSLFQLQSLETLLLSENLFNGSFQLDKIQRLVNLTQLDLSGNNLSVDVGRGCGLISQLKQLRLVSCNLHDFPDCINHSDISQLDLSNNSIAGEIPSWIWGTQLKELNLSFNLLTDLQKPYHIPASLQILDLRSNQLSGELHVPVPLESRLSFLSLANNTLSGSIPASLCNATGLDVVDLSVNTLSGNIPPCLVEKNIRVLDLGRNNINGRIPDNFSLPCSLTYLDLNNNNLQGKIPKSLQSCGSLEFFNIGNNIINDSFPCMQSSTLRMLVLRSNRFHGEVRCHQVWSSLQVVDISSNDFSGSLESINLSSWRAMVLGSDVQLRHISSGYYSLGSFGVTLIMKGLQLQYVKIWPGFIVIDFSSNNFGGEMPNAIGDLSSLRNLNISHNGLTGSIPKSFGELRTLESLDLSQNQIRGAIPMELGRLTSLSVLNLSYNKLVGEIPNGPQLQTFTADSFIGNPGLCGFNLNISCRPTTDDGSSDLSPPEHQGGEIEWEYVSAALGYVVGLGSIGWLLLFCRSFKERYFGKIEEVVEDIFNARDMRRRRARRALRNRVRRQ